MSRLAHLLALFALIAALLGPALPSFASVPPMDAKPTHAALDCSGHRHAPMPHGFGTADCCLASLCALNLALPTAGAEILPAIPTESTRYGLPPLAQPLGIDTAPFPHPPKRIA